MNKTQNRATAVYEFEKSRRQAAVKQIAARLSGRDTRLLPFEAIRSELRQQNPMYKGIQDIPLDAIVGSVGRYREFNRQFLPLSDNLQERWVNLQNLAQTTGWPPIEAYKVGNIYFVKDGNHRVSVARHLKIAFLEGHVWEYPESLTVDPDENLDQIFIQLGEQNFLQKTELDKQFPEHNIRFTAPGRYTELLSQIHDLRQKLAEIDGEPMPYADAVAAWYEMLYLPIIQIIQDANMLADFPGRTEADIFVWLSKYRYELREMIGEYKTLTELASILTERYREDRLSRLSRQVRRLLGSEALPPLDLEPIEEIN